MRKLCFIRDSFYRVNYQATLVIPQSPAKCYGTWQEERARDDISVHQGSGMTTYSWRTKGHEAPRTLEFIHYIRVKDNG